jgi:hypothetical protein
MGLFEKLRELCRVAFFAGDNWISILGVVLTTGAGFTLVWSWFLEFASPHTVHPYVGIVLFMLLPMVFVLGLLLIPAGILLRRRTLRRAGHLPLESPKVDLGSPKFRRVLVIVGAATLLNILLMGTATVKGVDYMDSSRFCGLTCHTPMITEYRAFLDSPHSRVGCAQCHIGPGTQSFMRAKLAGVRQVFGVVFNNYHRPIPTPVENLRPARETCEGCHWPQKFSGNKLVVRTHYAEDAASTPSSTVLLLKIGGHAGESNTGIHGRHLDAGARITYQPGDPSRETIASVTYKDDKGQEVEYRSSDVKITPEAAKLPARSMDCVDCHNRASHIFVMPDQAMDDAITNGLISRDLPFIKKQGLQILKADYPDQATAAVQIPKAVSAFYQANYPEVYQQKRAQVDTAGKVIADAFLRNVSPEMKLTWGTHPNHLGHLDGGGCFRCHDGSHTAKDGRSIASACDTCHVILAQDDKDPKILKDLGFN